MTDHIRGTGLPVGTRLVSSWERERRKTESELRRMNHTDRLLYEIENPKTEADRAEAFEREDAMADYGEGGDVIVGSILWDDGPGDYLED